MRSALVLLTLLGLTSAIPKPQLIDVEGVEAAPNPVFVVPAYDVLEEAGAINKPSIAPRARLLRRNGICALQPAGSGPVSSPDTPEAFLSNPAYPALAENAPTPDGYSVVMQNAFASLSASNYMGLRTLKSYDTLGCASLCDQAPGCQAFNMYIERDPSLAPNVDSCPNPPSITNFKCTLWGAAVSAAQATNKGQWRASFQVVIAGSNAYNKASPPPAIACYTGPARLAGAINAPLNTQGQNTYMGYKYHPFSQTQGYDVSTCAADCNAQTAYNKRHPAADGSYQTCAFINAYVLSMNGVPQGLYCSMYTQTWAASYATNYGQYRGTDRYTVSRSYSYSLNLASDGTPACDSSTTSQSSMSRSSTSQSTSALSTTASSATAQTSTSSTADQNTSTTSLVTPTQTPTSSAVDSQTTISEPTTSTGVTVESTTTSESATSQSTTAESTTSQVTSEATSSSTSTTSVATTSSAESTAESITTSESATSQSTTAQPTTSQVTSDAISFTASSVLPTSSSSSDSSSDAITTTSSSTSTTTSAPNTSTVSATTTAASSASTSTTSSGTSTSAASTPLATFCLQNPSSGRFGSLSRNGNGLAFSVKTPKNLPSLFTLDSSSRLISTTTNILAVLNLRTFGTTGAAEGHVEGIELDRLGQNPNFKPMECNVASGFLDCRSAANYIDPVKTPASRSRVSTTTAGFDGVDRFVFAPTTVGGAVAIKVLPASACGPDYS
ncbi:MAG: hypothetical protein Q9171_000342 [Xanthocarpia ochracea]